MHFSFFTSRKLEICKIANNCRKSFRIAFSSRIAKAARLENMSLTFAPTVLRKLNGIFAVHKPSSMGSSNFANTVLQKLLQELNSMEQRPQKKMIVFDSAKSATPELEDLGATSALESTNQPVLVPDWFDHPLVQGPRYKKEDLRLNFGHALDHKACGIQLFSLQSKGAWTLKTFGKARLPRKYRIQCQLGLATLLHADDTKPVERSTWRHVSSEKVDRVLTNLQGAHRTSLILGSGVDLKSQKAYEMASEGLLVKSDGPSSTIILDAKLVEFNAPEFTIDVVTLNEACQDLRRLVHDMGIILKTSAICTNLRRIQDGPLLLEDPHTLIMKQLTIENVLKSMAHVRTLITPELLRSKTHYETKTVEVPQISEGLDEDTELLENTKLLSAT